jgi:hypothetical protein
MQTELYALSMFRTLFASCSGVDQVGVALGEEGADMDGLMKKMDRLQTAIDAVDGWELDRQVARATDALRCPPGTSTTFAAASESLRGVMSQRS